ncbi:MAG: Gfo/Idh/MocA family oxidoreductase [Pseudomonadota bacterium]
MEAKSKARLAVAGLGLVGRRHAALAAEHADLVALADPAQEAEEMARRFGLPLYRDLADLLAVEEVDGVVIATPNQRHVTDGLAAISAGVAALIEKPIAVDLSGAARLVSAAEAAGVPLLIGHHRRHNPLIAAARQVVQSGRLGRLLTIEATCWLPKPASYFEQNWRRGPGAGPVLINLIHDIDLLLHLCGPVERVMAVTRSDLRGDGDCDRGGEVEDRAAAVLSFASGALGTVSVSDGAVAPWSWEMTAAENPAYPVTGASCYRIAGSAGALSIPDMTLWSQPKPDWHQPMSAERVEVSPADPLMLQIQHFSAVALGEAEPLVDGAAGMAALEVTLAIKQAAETGLSVDL